MRILPTIHAKYRVTRGSYQTVSPVSAMVLSRHRAIHPRRGQHAVLSRVIRTSCDFLYVQCDLIPPLSRRCKCATGTVPQTQSRPLSPQRTDSKSVPTTPRPGTSNTLTSEATQQVASKSDIRNCVKPFYRSGSEVSGTIFSGIAFISIVCLQI